MAETESSGQVFEVAEDDIEVKAVDRVMTASVSAHPLDTLLHHFSDWIRLKKAVGWLLRWRNIMIASLQGGSSVNHNVQNVMNFLSLKELQAAEVEILAHVQSQFFSEEIDRLQRKMPLRDNSSIRDLDPFLHDGLLRVGGRLGRIDGDNAWMDVHQIIVPHQSTVAYLIARYFHEQGHIGTEWTIGLIRSQFWITRIRPVVNSVRHKCVPCKKFFGKAAHQKMADLPLGRIDAFSKPFSKVGVDCFGPILVKRGRVEVKRYGVIFSCFVVRAVHLELMESMDTDSFLNAFRRFVSRRGMAQEIWSDNGTNFVAARKKLGSNVQWNFIPPHAPHMGGTWERMIRTVKRVLVAVMPCARLTDESLRTILCEIEWIVNSRPLTKASDDIKDGAVLTPNDLLLINCSAPVPPGSFSESDLYRTRWRCVQHVANVFWKKWMAQYLPELSRRRKWQKVTKSLAVGDVVLIVDQATARSEWPLELVVEAGPGDDGLVRSVKLRLANGTFLKRPIVKVVNLECVH